MIGDNSKMFIDQLFKEAGLTANGPVLWEDSIDEKKAGVYLVAMQGTNEKWPLCKTKSAQFQPLISERLEKERWISNEEIIYIGQTTKQSLRKRINQYYNHVYGRSSPHRGGQAVLLLSGQLVIYWSCADLPKKAEAIMLMAFAQKHKGLLPYANRKYPSSKWLLAESEQ